MQQGLYLGQYIKFKDFISYLKLLKSIFHYKTIEFRLETSEYDYGRIEIRPCISSEGESIDEMIKSFKDELDRVPKQDHRWQKFYFFKDDNNDKIGIKFII
jgi:hypothetical protein